MHSALDRRRIALFVLFFIPGVAMASWVTRTPAIRDSIDVSIAEMGLVLLGLSFGSMSGILLAGVLVGRFGTRSVALVGSCLIPTGLVVMGLGVLLVQASVVAAGLTLFGLGMGLGEIAVNIDGADVERATDRPLMHTLHGFFSLGTVCGATIGFALTAFEMSVELHLALIALLTVPVIFFFIRHIPDGTARDVRRVVGGSALVEFDPYWRDSRLLLIGIIVLGMALAEGAANDWLPILMVDEHGYSQTAGSLVFLVFAITMTVGRFSGGYLLALYGRVAVIAGSATLCAIGLLLVVFSCNPMLAGGAVLLWGMGASLGFPIAISAAGKSGPNATGRVKAVTISGYFAFLVGPPLLGLIGDMFGLRSALLLVATLVILAAAVSGVVSPNRPILNEKMT